MTSIQYAQCIVLLELVICVQLLHFLFTFILDTGWLHSSKQDINVCLRFYKHFPFSSQTKELHLFHCHHHHVPLTLISPENVNGHQLIKTTASCKAFLSSGPANLVKLSRKADHIS